MAGIRWNDQRYGQLIHEKRQTLIDEDILEGGTATDVAEDLLLRTPGLGPYVRKKRGYLNSVESVARDILNGVGFDKWYT
jgi:hypothetical protein